MQPTAVGIWRHTRGDQGATPVAAASPRVGFALLVTPKSLPFVWHSLGPEPSLSCLPPMPLLLRGSVVGVALALLMQLIGPTPLRAVLADSLGSGTPHSLSHLQIR